MLSCLRLMISLKKKQSQLSLSSHSQISEDDIVSSVGSHIFSTVTKIPVNVSSLPLADLLLSETLIYIAIRLTWRAVKSTLFRDLDFPAFIDASE